MTIIEINFTVDIGDFGRGAGFSCLATILDLLSQETIALQLMVCNSEVTYNAFTSGLLDQFPRVSPVL